MLSPFFRSFSTLIPFLILISLSFHGSNAASVFFSKGNLTVQAQTNYAFQLVLNKAVPANEVVTLTFSSGYTLPSGTPGTCLLGSTSLSGCTCSSLSCSIPFPATSAQTITLELGAITNPSALTSISFVFSSTTLGTLTISSSKLIEGSMYVLSASVATPKVQETTSYTIKFQLTYAIPQGGSIILKFPSDTTNGIYASSNKAIFTYADGTTVNYDCTSSSEEKVTISDPFVNAAYTDVANPITMTLNNIVNQQSVGTSSSITIETFNSANQGINIQVFTVSITQAGTTTYEGASVSGDTTINTATNIDIQFSFDISFVDTVSGPYYYVSLIFPDEFTVLDSSSCSAIGGLVSPNMPSLTTTCAVIDSHTLYLEYVIYNSQNSPVILSAYNIQTPYSTRPFTDPIQIAVYMSSAKTLTNPQLLAQGNYTWDWTATPGTLTINSVARTLDTLGSSVTLTYDFTLPDTIDQGSLIVIDIPENQAVFASTPTCKKSSGTSLTCTITQDSDGNTQVVISNYCSDSTTCVAGADIVFTLSGTVTNPQYVQLPEGSSMNISTMTSDGLYYFHQNTGDIYATTSLIANVPTDIDYQKTGAQYQVVNEPFTLSMEFTPYKRVLEGAFVYLHFPTEAIYQESSSSLSCSYKDSGSNSGTGDCYVEYHSDGTSFATIGLEVCSGLGSACVAPLTFTITGIKNPGNNKPIPSNDATNPWIIETGLSLDKRIDYKVLTSELPNITIIPNTFVLNDLKISNPMVGASSEYVLEFTIATPIPNKYNSRIIVTIPTDMSIQSSSCTATLADSTTLSCVQGTNLITISSTSSLAADSIITLTLNLLNPANTKPSSAITLRSVSTIDSVDYLIDTLYNDADLIITATAGSFSDVSLQVLPQTVGSKAQNTFKLTPTTNIPPYSQYSSRIVIELPGTMVFLSLITLPKCSANTTSGVKLSCAYDSDSTPQTITISHTDSTLDLAGVPITVVVPASTIQSPTSTKPTTEIIITSVSTIDSVDYPIDELTSGFINDQVNQPAPITVYSAVKNNSRVNQTTDLTVTFTPINTITSVNVIALSLPKQQIVLSSDLSGLTVLYNSVAIPILSSDEDANYINIAINTPCSSCPESISFKITGFVNPSEIVKFTQSILLETKTSDQLYLIDAVTSGFNTTPKLSSGDLIDLTFSSSSNVVGTATTATITFSIATEISTAGQLSITFPDDFMFTSGSGISCKNTFTSSSLFCLSTDGTSDYPNPISAISIIIGSQCQSSCAKGTQFSLSISGLKNAFSTKAYTGSIEISTVDDGSTVDTDEVETATLPALVAGALEVTKLTRDSNSISASTQVTLSIQLATLIISKSKLSVDFSESNSLVLASTATPTCSLVTSSATTSLSCANQGTNSLVISGLCSLSKSPCAAGSAYKILITGAQNADYVKSPLTSSDSVIVMTTDSEGNPTDEADSGIVVSPALQVNTLVVKNSAITNRDINSVADWSFVITLATPLKTPNQLYIQLPESTLLKSSSTAVTCKTSASASATCSVSLYSDSSLGIESITVGNLCGSSTTCTATQSLTITIKNLLNPPAVYTTNGDITFSTQNSDSKGDFYTTDSASDDWISLLGSLVPGDITLVSMSGNLPYASVLTNVTTTFYNTDPIPLDGVIVMKLPSDLIIPNFVESEKKCVNILGFNSSLQCRLEDSQLTLTNAFSTDQQASVFSFKLLNILNPLNPTFTSSGVANINPFNLTIQDDNAYLIDQSPNFIYTLITRDPNLVCDTTCLTCTQTSTHCTSCKTPSDYPLLSNNTCVASCPTGTISQSGVCVSCYPNCASCSGASSNQCLTCTTPYLLSDGVCVLECPPTTIEDAALGTCVRNETEAGGCTGNCATCSTSSGYCLTCDSPYVLDPLTHTCIDPSTTSCSDSYYYDSATGTCKPCDSSCITCTSSATQCTTCNPLFHPYLDTTKSPAQCVDSCPKSTYVDSENRCQACDSTCLTCSGPSSTQCTSCNPSSSHPLLQYGQCVGSCSTGYVLSNDGLTCLLPCTDSHCYQCQENSLGTCITCENGYYLSNGKCKAIETCSSGQYWNTTTKACAACNPSCKTCSGSASNCTSCYTDYTPPLELDPSKLEYLYNGQCLQACPLGYTPDYSNDKKCEEYECNAPCETCSGESNKCYTCLDEYPYLYEDYCYETCPAGTTASKNKYGLTCEKISLLQSKYKLSPVIIALASGTGFSAFLLIFANVFYRKRGQGVNNRNALLVLLQILEVISKVMLIPNIWGIEHGLLFFTALTLFFNIGLGVNLNILYMPLYENHVQSIKGYMEENKRLLKTTKALTYAGGSNMIRMYGSGLFARQGNFEKVAQFRELEKKHGKMSLYVCFTQIVVDIVIMSLMNYRKDAFGISVFNVVFNAVILMCLLSDVVNFSAGIKKLFGKKNKTPPTIIHRVPIRNN